MLGNRSKNSHYSPHLRVPLHLCALARVSQHDLANVHREAPEVTRADYVIRLQHAFGANFRRRDALCFTAAHISDQIEFHDLWER